jgi:hypothetical protein
MEHESIDLEEQIERCRRIAGQLTDQELRHSLEALADDYETKLRRRRTRARPFMLRDP